MIKSEVKNLLLVVQPGCRVGVSGRKLSTSQRVTYKGGGVTD